MTPTPDQSALFFAISDRRKSANDRLGQLPPVKIAAASARAGRRFRAVAPRLFCLNIEGQALSPGGSGASALFCENL
ncbi:hypothetical protein MNBD_NITROSPINAE04-372 [hydrothermal vent metagenome]|uniref:Uncharacterized protein n=1 Tax=hydrothermal vent metagenome TaxID=652676 RepID=A0A3B1BI87_9ZZZZ